MVGIGMNDRIEDQSDDGVDRVVIVVMERVEFERVMGVDVEVGAS